MRLGKEPTVEGTTKFSNIYPTRLPAQGVPQVDIRLPASPSHLASVHSILVPSQTSSHTRSHSWRRAGGGGRQKLAQMRARRRARHGQSTTEYHRVAG